MTHSIDTAHGPHRGSGRFSTLQLVEMVIGIAVVVVLGVAAFAFFNSTETPIASTPVGTATLEVITHSALDPFETQMVTPQADTVDEPSDLNVEGTVYPRPEFL